MRCYRIYLNIAYKDQVTNEDARRKIQVLTMVKKWKVKWFGRILMSSSLAKVIPQYAVKGKKKKRYTEEKVDRRRGVQTIVPKS